MTDNEHSGPREIDPRYSEISVRALLTDYALNFGLPATDVEGAVAVTMAEIIDGKLAHMALARGRLYLRSTSAERQALAADEAADLDESIIDVRAALKGRTIIIAANGEGNLKDAHLGEGPPSPDEDRR